MAAVDGGDLGALAAVDGAFFLLSGGCLGGCLGGCRGAVGGLSGGCRGAVGGLSGGCLGGCRWAVWGAVGGLSGGCFLPAVSLPRADSKNNNKPPPCKQPTAAL